MISRKCIYIFFSFLLFHCTAKKNNPAELTVQAPTGSSATPASIIGEWNYGFPFYNSTLTISDNGTFQFYSRSCMGQNYSEGNWHRQGDYIFLTSFEKYKKNIEPEFISNPSPVKKGKIKKNNKSNFTVDLTESTYSVIVNFPDTFYTYFDRQLLRFQDNFLQEIDKYGSYTDTKYRKRRSMYSLAEIKPPPPSLPEFKIVKK